MSWGGRYSPVALAAKTAVICLLSSAWAVITDFLPYLSMVQFPVGEIESPI